jgi:hypothetical protein
MDAAQPPKSEALRARYWRAEILQLMWWLRGEGFGDLVDAPMLERFLDLQATAGLGYLYRLADEGFLERDGEWFTLSSKGLQGGALEFATAFNEPAPSAGRACSTSCWCHLSVDEAAACAAERGGRGGGRP